LEPGEEGSQTASDHERVVRIFGNNAGNVQNARTEVEYVEEVRLGKSTWDDGTTWRVAGRVYVKKEVLYLENIGKYHLFRQLWMFYRGTIDGKLFSSLFSDGMVFNNV